jgi:hypothetical protein
VNLPKYQTVSVACPSCGTRFATPVLTLIDAGQHPEAKALFLSGQANVAVCPQCGNAGMLSTPLVYHDPEKELLFTYVPQEMGMSEMEQQRLIGDLTNALMAALPAEQRKGYLLRPRSFLRLEAMINAILEADGITPEMLEAQRARATLLDRLLRATSDEARQIIAQENQAQIDYEFFQLLTLNLELAQSEGQEQIGQELLRLRQQLLEWTATGQEIADREDAIRSLGREVTREGLLDKLVEAALAGKEARIETLVAFARPAIDYVFYQQLTERIEAAEKARDTKKARTLKDLRQSILGLTARIDAELQQATDEAAQFLQEILDSDDPEEALLANLDQVDELFLSVLAREMEATEKTGQQDRAERLQRLSGALLAIIEESQPPQIRLINQLLSSDYPQGTQALLEENREQMNDQLLEIMDLVHNDLVQNGRKKLAERLVQIRAQAAALV